MIENTIKDYAARKLRPGSALGDYSNPTISSQKKARSRSSSQKPNMQKRPSSRYTPNVSTNPINENRQQIQLKFQKKRYQHISIMIHELKRGICITLNNSKQHVIMKVFQSHLEVQKNSVNQTLSIQPYSNSIKKIKIGFDDWNTQSFEIKIKSLQGRISPNNVTIDTTTLFHDDFIQIQPFIMIEEAQLLRKKMLLRMNSKKPIQAPLQQISNIQNIQKQNKQNQYTLLRKPSLKFGFNGIDISPKPNSHHPKINRIPRKSDQNSFYKQPQLKKNSSGIQKQSGYSFKKIIQQSKATANNITPWVNIDTKYKK